MEILDNRNKLFRLRIFYLSPGLGLEEIHFRPPRYCKSHRSFDLDLRTDVGLSASSKYNEIDISFVILGLGFFIYIYRGTMKKLIILALLLSGCINKKQLYNTHVLLALPLQEQVFHARMALL